MGGSHPPSFTPSTRTGQIRFCAAVIYMYAYIIQCNDDDDEEEDDVEDSPPSACGDANRPMKDPRITGLRSIAEKLEEMKFDKGPVGVWLGPSTFLLLDDDEVSTAAAAAFLVMERIQG